MAGMRRRLLIVLAVASGAFAEFPRGATTPTFTPTGSMHVARAGHQATLLLDGRVLVTGGYNDSGNAIAQTEIFSAVTGTWSTGASNITARTDHAVARLRDGRVMVVGGVSSFSACQAIATAEIYDPSSAAWSAAGDPPIAFGAGTIAVTLRDGRVLVAGGSRCGDIVNTTALFNPSTNAWSTAARMKTPRAFHSAVLLANGRVLVVGGAAGAEMFDPASAAWTPTEGPEASRLTSCGGYMQSFLSMLPDGRVLAAGGVAGDCPARVGPAATVELFDAAQSRWSIAGKLEVPRALTAPTVLPDGRAIVAGGYAGSGTLQSSAEFFDPGIGGWILNGALHTPRVGHTATRLTNGTVLVAGGISADGRTTAAEIYIPEIGFSTNTSIPFRQGLADGARMPVSRGWGVATNSKGHIFLAHGPGGNHLIAEWDVQREPLLAGFVKEIGAGLDEIHSLRIDADDSMWVVAGATNTIVKLNLDGQILLRFGGPVPSAGFRTGLTNPTDLATDRSGNVFVTDGRRGRVVKFDAAGRFVNTAGSPGTAPGEMKTAHSIAADANGRVYVADGNARIQVFDNDLKRLAIYDTVGQPWALCITPGPHQYLYSASNPDQTDTTRGVTGEIYKLELDGTVVGKIGRVDNALGNFRSLHSIDCREENELVAVPVSNFMHIIHLSG
jgi:DNA-binding beta-propeller fold protein YncE